MATQTMAFPDDHQGAGNLDLVRQRSHAAQSDCTLLVEYFIDRYARKAGKHFRSVEKRTLQVLQSYPWPGNIRELQNVIERSVIVCETEKFLGG